MITFDAQLQTIPVSSYKGRVLQIEIIFSCTGH